VEETNYGILSTGVGAHVDELVSLEARFKCLNRRWRNISVSPQVHGLRTSFHVHAMRASRVHSLRLSLDEFSSNVLGTHYRSSEVALHGLISVWTHVPTASNRVLLCIFAHRSTYYLQTLPDVQWLEQAWCMYIVIRRHITDHYCLTVSGQGGGAPRDASLCIQYTHIRNTTLRYLVWDCKPSARRTSLMYHSY
jgi:hypothetical protein